ncbi:UNVERIFIED_ORG: hypothetical protein FHU00_4958 [Citrobacter freundii]
MADIQPTVDMIVFAIHLDQLRLEVCADIGEYDAQPVDGVAVEHFVALFRHKDQMNVHLKNAVSSAFNIVVIAHRPMSMIEVCNDFQPSKTN